MKYVKSNKYRDIEVPDNIGKFRIKFEVSNDVDNSNYRINILSPFKRENFELSQLIQNATKLNFPPYDWRSSSYNYYTSNKITDEDKSTILKELVSEITKFNVEHLVKQNASIIEFENDINSDSMVKIPDFTVIPSLGNDKLFLIPKKFLGNDKFTKYSKITSGYGKITEDLSVNEIENIAIFVAKDLGKCSYFYVLPSDYSTFKTEVVKEELAKNLFYAEQKKIAVNMDMNQYTIKDKNIFGINVDFNEDLGCFEFYGKGYFDQKDLYGTSVPRKLIQLWALNFIYSTETDIFNTNTYTSELRSTDRVKIELSFLEGSSRKDKKMLCPASDWQKFEIIKENLEKEQNLWAREKVVTRVHGDHLNLSFCFENYPGIIFSEEGNAYLIYSAKSSSVKAKEKYLSLSGILITPNEVNYFLNEHPFCENIKKQSIEATGLMDLKEQTFTFKQFEDFFNTKLEKYNLTVELKSVKQDCNPKRNKLKI